MSSVKRRINSTGRKRIGRDHIDIHIVESKPGEPLTAKAKVRLDDLGFPPSAGVAIDAYHRSTGMRFDCGTVGEIKVPDILVLEEIDQAGAVLFRLKVIDNEGSPGKLLGAAERITPREPENVEGKRSIFPVIQRDLGAEVWKVEILEDAQPTLILNSRIPGITHRILGSPLARGLLLPAALRMVLERLVEDPTEEDTDDSQWRQEWIEFTREKLGLSEDLPTISAMGTEAREEWVGRALDLFCKDSGFVDDIRAMNEPEHSHA